MNLLQRSLRTRLLLTSIALLCCAPASASNEDLGFQETSYCTLAKQKGLSLNKDGTITHCGTHLKPVLPEGDTTVAAAFHEDAHVLTVVTEKALVICYSVSGNTLTEMERFAPPFLAQTRTVRFSHLPGLVYLLCDNVKKMEMLKGNPLLQDYSDEYYRLALVESAGEWQAIPLRAPDETLLGAAYYLQEKTIFLVDDEAKQTQLKLPELLAPCKRSGPGDSLAQAVFLFPGDGIVCHTEHGWSLFRPDGSLEKAFSTNGIQVGWWGNPYFENGHFYVHACNGPGGTRYLLDTSTGTLTVQEEPRVIPKPPSPYQPHGRHDAVRDGR